MPNWRVVCVALDLAWWAAGAACLAAAVASVRGNLHEPKERDGDRLARTWFGVALPAAAALFKTGQYAANELAADSGLTVNFAWNFIHGAGQTSDVLNGRPYGDWHFAWALPLLSPLLLVVRSAGVLAAVQGAIVGLVPYGVYRLSRALGSTPALCRATALMALGHPCFHELLCAIIDDTPLAAPLFVWAAWAWASKRPGLAAAFGMLFLATREQAPLVLLGAGAAGALSGRGRLRATGFAAAALSVPLWFWEMSLTRKADWALFSHLGPDAGSVLALVWREPWTLAAAAAWPPTTLAPTLKALLAAGFMPLLAGSAALPFWAALIPHALARPDSTFHGLILWYPGIILGPLLAAAAVGFARYERGAGRRRASAAALALAAAAAGFFSFREFRTPARPPTAWRTSVPAALAHVPPNAIVWTEPLLTPRFATRRHVRTVPPSAWGSREIVLVPDRVVLSAYWARLADPAWTARLMGYLSGFVVVYHETDLVVFANPMTIGREGVAPARLTPLP